jgi:EGF domain
MLPVPLSCSDINECATTFTGRKCSPQAACNNSLGSYSCRCNDGFSGDGFTCSGKRFVDFRLAECIWYARARAHTHVHTQSLDRRSGYGRDVGSADKTSVALVLSGSTVLGCLCPEAFSLLQVTYQSASGPPILLNRYGPTRLSTVLTPRSISFDVQPVVILLFCIGE